MFELFKQKIQQPFSYPSIEMRKTSGGYSKWVVVIIVFIVVLFIFFGIR